MSNGLLIVLSGPGGVGKTSLVGEMMRRDPGIRYTKSVTTRESRLWGKDEFYEYVTEDAFAEHVANGDFVQWINPPGLEYFGTLRRPIDDALAAGHDMVFDYVPEGLLNLRRFYPHNTVGVFVMAPSVEIMETRLAQRGSQTDDEAATRYAMAMRDFAFIDDHDYFVVNHDLETTVDQLFAIREAEKLRVERSPAAARFRAEAKQDTLLRIY